MGKLPATDGPDPLVTVVSSYTRDHLRDEGAGVRVLPGGPAHYIGQALERLGCTYQLITGESVDVEVLPGPEGEQYLIPDVRPIHLPQRLVGAAVILSPVMQEIRLGKEVRVEGLLVVDLQGFVRTPNRPSEEQGHSFRLTTLLKRADVVKASASELARLDAESTEALQDRLLLLTRGKAGVSLIRRSERCEIAARPVAGRHTIGAGDTLLAAFVCALVRGSTEHGAAEQAVRFTEQVLQDRLGGDFNVSL